MAALAIPLAGCLFSGKPKTVAAAPAPPVPAAPALPPEPVSIPQTDVYLPPAADPLIRQRWLPRRRWNEPAPQEETKPAAPKPPAPHVAAPTVVKPPETAPGRRKWSRHRAPADSGDLPAEEQRRLQHEAQDWRMQTEKLVEAARTAV